MAGNIIKIPSHNNNNLYETEDILHSLVDIKNTYRNKIKDPNNHLESLIKEYASSIINNEIDSIKIVEIWKQLLGRYYYLSKKDDNGKFLEGFYIFPYQIVEGNNTLWFLKVNTDGNYEGGVKDERVFLEEEWTCNIELSEITEEEFKQKAIESTNRVINYRLNKLKKKL